jgi:hypothetical protein
MNPFIRRRRCRNIELLRSRMQVAAAKEMRSDEEACKDVNATNPDRREGLM